MILFIKGNHILKHYKQDLLAIRNSKTISKHNAAQVLLESAITYE